MKKPTSKIREELARLQEQLKQAETRDAERIGRIALKAGLGEIEIDDADLQAAFEEVAKRFRGNKAGSNGKEKTAAGATGTSSATSLSAGAAASQAGEA
jgi:predicted unusual protein kinase regulating ubiquinone biosynthesis (AarF/ABC1/UbiB family)